MEDGTLTIYIAFLAALLFSEKTLAHSASLFEISTTPRMTMTTAPENGVMAKKKMTLLDGYFTAELIKTT